jgi:hypothetical protein
MLATLRRELALASAAGHHHLAQVLAERIAEGEALLLRGRATS